MTISKMKSTIKTNSKYAKEKYIGKVFNTDIFCIYKKATVLFLFCKKNNNISKLYFQISAKDMWLIPKYDKNFLDGKMPLFGWIIFYFGYKKRGE